MGNGTLVDSLVPTVVTLPSGVTGFRAISTGQVHSLAIGSDGKLYGWGQNTYGQLGDGTTTNRNIPVLVSLPAGVSPVTIVAGSYHSMTLGSDGKLYLWGGNSYGQVGDGTTINRKVPVALNFPPGVTSFSSFSDGYAHSIALGNDGNVYNWGFNGYGELGDGTTNSQSTPLKVNFSNVTGSFTKVFAGAFHNFVLSSDGTLYSWGYNGFGQLGDGTNIDRHTPIVATPPAGTSGFTNIIMGGNHNLGLGTDGKLYAWGRNDAGQLGDGSNIFRSIPSPVSLPAGVTNFSAVFSGGDCSFAMGSDNNLYAWGVNNHGQLGDGSTTNRNSPVPVNLGGVVTAISTGDFSLILVS